MRTFHLQVYEIAQQIGLLRLHSYVRSTPIGRMKHSDLKVVEKPVNIFVSKFHPDVLGQGSATFSKQCASF